MDADFRPDDGPAAAVGRVRAWVESRRDAPTAETVPLAIAKLRLLGVYDDRQPGFFMLRLRLPGGRLAAAQARLVAELADELSARPDGADRPDRFVEITTRQTLQLHWIRFENLPAIWERCDAAGLTSYQACGDTLRNITSCARAGLDPDEIVAASPAVDAVNRLALDEPELAAFLPRKFKVAISGCRSDCVLARIHDLAFVPAERDGRRGFNVLAGGGLSDYPRLASPLDLFVTPQQVAPVVRAALVLFRDLGDFEHKAVNRFRLLVDRLGPDQVATELQSRLPFRPEPAGIDLSSWQADDHLGVQPERRAGRVSVGLNVPFGRLAAAELDDLADLASRYGTGQLRLTRRQNAILVGVDATALERLLAEPLLARLRPEPDPFERAVVACTSAPYCKFGIVNAKEQAAELVDYLRTRIPPRDWDKLTGLRINIAGCKASCAQTQAGQIGLRGSIAADERGLEPAFDLALGGNPSAGRLAKWAALQLPHTQAFATIAELLTAAAADSRPLDEAIPALHEAGRR